MPERPPGDAGLRAGAQFEGQRERQHDGQRLKEAPELRSQDGVDEHHRQHQRLAHAIQRWLAIGKGNREKSCRPGKAKAELLRWQGGSGQRVTAYSTDIGFPIRLDASSISRLTTLPCLS